ncbi:PilC/PilY family type IV pilus protein [Halopseudomonas salina]|uniref:Type IV pilus-associated protein n=1 Tax=Halopseudomonas salina TaxID=1323744 RepID=A0ABQ1Q4J0_9GAMM|nr:PilC/PilY family type IV pilus protein [Halopseudomonas salina]GGD11444.1 type IV pilus-associated protein [Halopseudomonas salina]
MCIIRSEPRRLVSGIVSGVFAGIFLALPAQAAFNPLSGPILSAPAVAPNVLMLFDNSSSMVLNRVGNETRLTIARDVAKDVIINNRQVRFGLFGFRDTVGSGAARDAPGGELLVEVGDIAPGTASGAARFTTLINRLDNINPRASAPYTYTPLAETYYEMTRYLRGLRAFYPQSTPAANRQQFVSPVEYRCQQNFGLVITDGLPTYDSQFPVDIGTEPDINNPGVVGSINLPDWDGAGDVNSTDPSDEGSTFYLDDIARFAFDVDMRNAGRSGVSTDLAGMDWDDPAFAIQNMRTFTVGFALNDANLQRAATLGGGRYYTAANRQELDRALNSALGEINSTSASGGASVASGPELASGSRFYRSLYDPSDWSGAVEAHGIDSDGSAGARIWSTDTTVTANSNALFQTWRLPSGANQGAVVPLGGNTYSGLGPAQKAVLDLASGSNSGQDLLDWSMGQAVPGYRIRTRLMGDVVNSSLVLARAGEALASSSHTGYAAYRADKHQNMVSSLLAGANDGFVHVLAARDGAHRLAFLPAALQEGLGARASVDLVRNGHQSGMDGPIVVGDAVLNSTWTTMAVAGYGAGGKGLTGIRLYDQSAGNGALGALWEIGPTTSGYANLGHVYGEAVITQLDGRWVAVAGNGYGNTAGQPELYVIDLADGSLIKSLAAGAADPASGNGLSAPRVATNGSGQVVAAYAGDLQGRLWKFDLAGPPVDWRVAFAGDPLFRAGIAVSPEQPITTRPVLLDHPQGGKLVLFGTGQFLEAADRLDTDVQAFYAVLDKPGATGNLDSGSLQPQAILSETTAGGRKVRTLSSHRVNWYSTNGWYLPLIYGNPTGERVTRNIVTRGGRVLFNTGLIMPGADPCVSAGAGWLMSIDSFSGGMLPVATLDSDGDGLVDSRDPLSAGVNLSGGLPGDLIVLELPRIKPLAPANPLATGSCDPSVEFCPCDPSVDDCVCDPADASCKNIYCGKEFNYSQSTNTLELVAGSGQCSFSRIMWRQLM